MSTELNEKPAEQNLLTTKIYSARERAAELRNRALTANLSNSAEASVKVATDFVALTAGMRPGTRIGDAGGRGRLEAAAALRAAHMLQAEIPTIERALADAKIATVDVALTVFRAERDAAHVEVLATVEALGLALARILATGLSCDALIGQRYSFDPALHPPATLWQPQSLVDALVVAMPSRFQPESWAENIERGACALVKIALQAKGNLK